MRVNFGQFIDISKERLNEFIRQLEQAFESVAEGTRHSYSVTLNFSAPSVVPGITNQTVTIDGAEVGDMVLVGAPVAVPAGFHRPVAEVTAPNTVVVSWLQFSGAAADPDGAGGLYRIDVWRH